MLHAIAAERRNLEGAKAVRRAVEASSKNEAVIQQAQNEVRAAQASIQFLEDELAKLQMGGAPGSASSSPAGTPQRPAPPPGGAPPAGYSSPGMYGQGNTTPTRQGASAGMVYGPGISPSPSSRTLASDRERPLPPPPGASAAELGAEPRRPEQKNYSQLGEC